MIVELEDWQVLIYAVLFFCTFPALVILFWIADRIGFGKQHLSEVEKREDADRLSRDAIATPIH